MPTVLERREAFDRGREGEALVARALESAGWVVLARNWRAEGGEIDLIVARDGVVRFVEVKARQEGDALESIGRSKRTRLARAAEAWLAENGSPREAAFLIALVGVSDGPSDEEWTVELWDDPF